MPAAELKGPVFPCDLMDPNGNTVEISYGHLIGTDI